MDRLDTRCFRPSLRLQKPPWDGTFNETLAIWQTVLPPLPGQLLLLQRCRHWFVSVAANTNRQVPLSQSRTPLGNSLCVCTIHQQQATLPALPVAI